jgi:cysteinyl-tRNA synthetase
MRPAQPLVLLAIALGATAVIAAVGWAPSFANPAATVRKDAAPGALRVQLEADNAAAERRRRIGAVRNWGYLLNSIDAATVAASPHQLLVIDNGVSANRRFVRELARESEVARMKQHPDGSPRILLAYLSIGEAERYRSYWRPEWYDTAKRPVWLGDVNPIWDGNYDVQFWHPGWQQLMYGTPEAYLDRILAQGFDGAFLDRADVWAKWEKARPSARADMVTFVRRLAEHARKRSPDFLMVMQNAEELLDDTQLMSAIDGVGKEDLLYGIDHTEAANKPEDVTGSLKYLQMARRAGRKVLVVEYLSDPIKMTAAAKRIVEQGFVPYFAPRLLNCLNPPAVPAAPANAPAALPEHPCR